MVKRKIFMLLCCFFCLIGAPVFVAAPGQAQTVTIRLFEIFLPQSLEIYAAERNVPANSSATHLANTRRDQSISKTENTEHLLISAANGPLFDAAPSRVRIVLTNFALQIQSANGSRSLPLTDTVKISANDNYLFAAIPHPNDAKQKAKSEKKMAGNSSVAARPYAGALQIYADGDELGVINFAPVADYLAGVLAAELPQAELPALQAQAVVSRTYMIKNWQRHLQDGYRFCDLTHCQTYKGMADITPTIRQAVTSTADEFLTFDDQPIAAYYSSTCGGTTADDLGIWANAEDQPYLKSIADGSFCSSSPHYRWRARILADSLHQIWQRRLGEQITSISVTKEGADGRVRELALLGNSLHLISGEDFRAVTCRAFGWNTLKSTWFNVQIEKRAYVFNGRGLGHGLGLCQYGAMEMARRGFSYREI
ncbi:MAG: SpoIID/LytB domain-containing protein, partial [bacterium]